MADDALDRIFNATQGVLNIGYALKGSNSESALIQERETFNRLNGSGAANGSLFGTGTLNMNVDGATPTGIQKAVNSLGWAVPVLVLAVGLLVLWVLLKKT
jgi:hypothetical protein